MSEQVTQIPKAVHVQTQPVASHRQPEMVAIQGEPLRTAPGIPWVLLCIVALVIVGLFQGPKIIEAWRGGGDKPSPGPAPVSTSLFQSQADAQYFSEAAKSVAGLVKADGESPKPRYATVEQLREALPGALTRAVLLSGLKVDGNKLAEFVSKRFDDGLPHNAGPLTAEARSQAVAVYEKIAADVLEAAK